jgi:transcriptional regulator with PAS, ATPase and Fis domain
MVNGDEGASEMRLIVVGRKLQNSLFEIAQHAKDFDYKVLFFKDSINIAILSEDLILMDATLVHTLPQSLQNSVISVVEDSQCNDERHSENTVNFSSLHLLPKILKKLRANLSESPIFVDPLSLDVFQMAARIAPTDATVLITGETGTGKEVLAKYIHLYSHRRKNKYVSINCAAIPDTLLESELFGHEKGAFTNAIQRRIGKFEEANNGTILLDEISEMTPYLQAKLLRIIQEREFSRLGSNEVLKTNARIIATSNKDLKKSVKNGLFRSDLFYRLNVIAIEVPKLKDRILDIAPLAHFFCAKYSNSRKKISKELLMSIINNPWEGNIRELENFIHRAVLLSPDDAEEINESNNAYWQGAKRSAAGEK